MDIKIFACIIFYNDGVDMLRRAFESCERAGLPIIAIDGKFKEFEGPASSDKDHIDFCMEWFSSSPGHFIQGGEYADQMTKRNHYLQICKEEGANYCLVIDADEQLDNWTSVGELTEDSYMVGIEDSTNKWYPHGIRLHKVTKDLQYRNRHSFLYHTSEIENMNDINSGLKRREFKDMYLRNQDGTPVIIRHYPNERSKERMAQDQRYIDSRAEVGANANIMYESIDHTQDHDVTVKFTGKYYGPIYDGPFKIKAGEITVIPYWQYIRLINDFSPLDWELIK